MDLDFGLKFSKPVRDDLISTDLRINKDRGGLVFVFTETDSMFFLTAHLRGYKRENIRMSISPDGAQIKIEGQYPIEETLYVGGDVLRNIKTVEFKKSFRIPDGVVLNGINATFDDECVLTITMPKAVYGIRGILGLEEVMEFDHVKGLENENLAKTTLDDQNVDESSSIANRDRVDNKIEPESRIRTIQENSPTEASVDKKDDKSQEGKDSPKGEDNRKSKKDSNMCHGSIILGSALFASLIAIVFHFVKKKSAEKRNNC